MEAAAWQYPVTFLPTYEKKNPCQNKKRGYEPLPVHTAQNLPYKNEITLVRHVFHPLNGGGLFLFTLDI